MIRKNEVEEEYKLTDLGTFEQVFKNYYSPLVIYANTFMKDINESQDIVQQIFVSMWEKRKSMHVHTSLKALLYKAVYNTCLNRIKQQKVRSDHAKEVQLSTNNWSVTDETIHQKELQKKIDIAIDLLPEQCAKIFKLNRFENLKYQQIADKLGLSVKTVENQMGKALKRMREQLNEYLPFLILILITTCID